MSTAAVPSIKPLVLGDLEPELAGARRTVARFDGHVARLGELVAGAGDALLLPDWELRMGGKVMRRAPRASFLRGWVISHLVHHRAQPGVYLRLLDVPVPGVYGPTADEP